MKVAGIDKGTTYTKFAWMDRDGELKLRSTTRNSLWDVSNEMMDDGVRAIRQIGIGGRLLQPRPMFEELPVNQKNSVKAETHLQARGARYLAKCGSSNSLVVSIGTGVSYTRVMFGMPFTIPIGNSLGGGYLDGMKKVFEKTISRKVSWEDFDYAASNGNPSDIMVCDVIPEHPVKDLVLSNFGKYDGSTESIASGAISTVAVAIAKDLILYSLLTGTVIFVGTPTELKSLRVELSKYSSLLNKNFVFLHYGAYAGAVGAMLGE